MAFLGLSLAKELEKNKTSIALALLGIFLLGVGVLSALVLSSKRESSSIEILPAEEDQTSEIFIHVSGAVEKPGLYQLSAGARVNDALVVAGGLSAEADRQWFEKTVNLAQKLSDGVKLHIPFKGEPSSASFSQETGMVAGEQTLFSQDTQGKVNINKASVSQLDSLSGIGPAYAQRIIDYRNNNSPFNSIEDIMKVSGIGQKTFEKIKDQITVF